MKEYKKMLLFYSFLLPSNNNNFYTLFAKTIFVAPSSLYDSRKLPFGDEMELNFYERKWCCVCE